MLDNVNIGRKLIILCVICIVIPVISTNFVIYNIIRKNTDAQRINEMNSTQLRLKYNISKIIDSVDNMISQLYDDKRLNDFLNTEYKGLVDYYKNYRMLQDDKVLSFYFQSEYISNISIFSNNKTITRSGSIYPIEEVKDEEWFQDMLYLNEGDIKFITYYSNPKVKKTYDAYTLRKVSILAKLNQYSELHKYIKIDLNYTDLERLVYNEKSFQDIIIECNGKILFDTRGSRLDNKNFKKYKAETKDRLVVKNTINIFDDNWNVIVVADRGSFIDSILYNTKLIYITCLINLIIPIIAIKLIGDSLRKRIYKTEDSISKLNAGQYECIDCYEGSDEIGHMIVSYNRMVVRIRELVEVVLKGEAERQKLQISEKQAELQALQSQVNPHFMFNTLESIRMRSLINGERETAEIVGILALHMRRTIQWSEDFPTIGEEIEFLTGYLEIQKYRFGERLNYSIHIQEECKNQRIPKFGILTFVENSCIHGIEKKIKGGNIDIIVMKDDDRINIEIMDNGAGIEKEQLEKIQQSLKEASMSKIKDGKSIGMLNAYIRLKMYYQDDAEIQIDSVLGEGTDIYMSLPYIEKVTL